MDNQSKILAYCCEWGGYSSLDQAGMLGIPMSTGLRVLEVRCVGQLDPRNLLEPLLHKAHGVLAAGCKRQNCHYVNGNIMFQPRVELVVKLLKICGVDPRRIKQIWLDAADGEGFAREVNEFSKLLATMGGPVTDSHAAQSLEAAIEACGAEKLRWLTGVGYDLRKTGNVFGRILTEKEYGEAMEDVMREAFLRARIVLLLKRSPMSSPELAEAAGEDLKRVSDIVTFLEKEGKVRHHSSHNGLPKFTAESA